MDFYTLVENDTLYVEVNGESAEYDISVEPVVAIYTGDESSPEEAVSKTITSTCDKTETEEFSKGLAS